MAQHLLLGTRKGLFDYRPTAAGWKLERVSFLGDPVSQLLVDPRDGRWYAASALGHFGVKLHRSANQGATWEEVAAPAYPVKPDDPDDRNPWTLSYLWALEPAGTAAGDLWAGTAPGGLFRSTDGGESWQLNRALWDRPERREWFGGGLDEPGIHSICPNPANPADVVIGISCGGVWLTADDGASWTLRGEGMSADFLPPEQATYLNLQDPHRIVRCLDQPAVLWATHHCDSYRSTDGGATWTALEVPPSRFGFAVAVSPRDAAVGWYIPAIKDQFRVPVEAQLVVARSRDGGRWFEVLRQGLPQQEAYDLVYRHALDVAADGCTLAFGSTTGNVWTTADAGDTWHLLNGHLPPVYAVRLVG
ncbi:MAG: hypothetical protein IT204_03135 [Fimbriimonadaceae bacterium]|nr:hypothetical protein [Fimbriimonadaceae bacterium]